MTYHFKNVPVEILRLSPLPEKLAPGQRSYWAEIRPWTGGSARWVPISRLEVSLSRPVEVEAKGG